MDILKELNNFDEWANKTALQIIENYKDLISNLSNEQENHVWLVIGIAISASLLISSKLIRFLPAEKSWHLTIVRTLVGRTVFWSTIVGLTSILIWSLSAWLISNSEWSISFHEEFWSYVAESTSTVFNGVIVGLVSGLIIVYALGRWIEPSLSKYMHLRTLKNSSIEIIDVSKTFNNMKEKPPFDPTKSFTSSKEEGVLSLGENTNNDSVDLRVENYIESNIQICGPPGKGKGIVAANIIAQGAINFGFGGLILDPKNDDWGPSVYKWVFEQAGKPFVVIDLTSPTPQFNPLLNCSQEEIQDLLITAFSLGNRGVSADHFKKLERKAARILSKFAFEKSLSLVELSLNASDALGPFAKEAEGLVLDLEEIASIASIQTNEGLDLENMIMSGGGIYVIGSTKEPIKSLLKLVFARNLQIIEKTQFNEDRPHITIFADEIAHLLSEFSVSMIGTLRSRRANCLLAHQSLSDFKRCGQDLNPEAVQEIMLDCTPIKLIYGTKHSTTIDWASALEGSKDVTRERVETERNSQLSESTLSTRSTHLEEQPYIHRNKILHMPRGCALCIGVGLAKFIYTSPLIVPKRKIEIIPAPKLNLGGSDDLL